MFKKEVEEKIYFYSKNWCLTRNSVTGGAAETVIFLNWGQATKMTFLKLKNNGGDHLAAE